MKIRLLDIIIATIYPILRKVKTKRQRTDAWEESKRDSKGFGQSPMKI